MTFLSQRTHETALTQPLENTLLYHEHEARVIYPCTNDRDIKKKCFFLFRLAINIFFLGTFMAIRNPAKTKLTVPVDFTSLHVKKSCTEYRQDSCHFAATVDAMARAEIIELLAL